MQTFVGINSVTNVLSIIACVNYLYDRVCIHKATYVHIATLHLLINLTVYTNQRALGRISPEGLQTAFVLFLQI